MKQNEALGDDRSNRMSWGIDMGIRDLSTHPLRPISDADMKELLAAIASIDPAHE